MVRVVVVEADREVTAKFLDAAGAHDRLSLPLHEGEERKLQLLGSGLDHDAHLHGDQVEDPGAVAHRIGQVAQFLDVGTAPDALQIDGLATERIGGQGRQNLLQRLAGDQLEVVRTVRSDVIVEQTLPQQLSAQVHRHLEIGVIAAADHLIGRLCGPVAQVGILAPADAENRLLGRHVEVAPHIVEIPHPRHQTAAAVDDNHTACVIRRTERSDPQAEILRIGLIQQRLVAAPENASVEQRRVLLPIPLQQRIDQIADLLLRLEGRAEIDRLQPDVPELQLLRQQVDHPRPVGRGVTVESDDKIPARRSIHACGKLRSQCRCGLERSADYGPDGLGRKLRTVYGPGIVVRKGVVHETHDSDCI